MQYYQTISPYLFAVIAGLKGYFSIFYVYFHAAASVNYPELSAYVSAEMKSLNEEIASLEKVTVKLESEIRQAMEIKGQFRLQFL